MLQARKVSNASFPADLELLTGRHAIEAAAQDQADIALFREQQVRLINQLAQDGARITVPALPEFRAVVAVKGDGDTERPSRARRAQSSFRSLRPDRRV